MNWPGPPTPDICMPEGENASAGGIWTPCMAASTVKTPDWVVHKAGFNPGSVKKLSCNPAGTAAITGAGAGGAGGATGLAGAGVGAGAGAELSNGGGTGPADGVAGAVVAATGGGVGAAGAAAVEAWSSAFNTAWDTP